jgi:hypothetical protein
MKGDEGLADNLARFIELQRKYGIRMIADSQFYYSVEKRLRESADLVIEVQSQALKYDRWGELVRVTWNVLEFDGAARYKRYKSTNNAKWARKTTYVHEGDIFTCYDSLAGHEYFMNGMVGNYHTKLATPSSNDKAAMVEKCAKYPAVKPPKKEKKVA